MTSSRRVIWLNLTHRFELRLPPRTHQNSTNAPRNPSREGTPKINQIVMILFFGYPSLPIASMGLVYIYLLILLIDPHKIKISEIHVFGKYTDHFFSHGWAMGEHPFFPGGMNLSPRTWPRCLGISIPGFFLQRTAINDGDTYRKVRPEPTQNPIISRDHS